MPSRTSATPTTSACADARRSAAFPLQNRVRAGAEQPSCTVQNLWRHHALITSFFVCLFVLKPIQLQKFVLPLSPLFLHGHVQFCCKISWVEHCCVDFVQDNRLLSCEYCHNLLVNVHIVSSRSCVLCSLSFEASVCAFITRTQV